MCSGVGKSGSPTLKSTTSCPARRRRSAYAATFIVADSETCANRCANMPAPALRLLLPHPLLDDRRHEAAHVAAKAEDLFDQPRAEIGVLFRRHHEDRLERRLEMAVHQRHLKLVLEVRHRAQPADERAGTAAPRILDQQPLEGVDLDVRVFTEYAADDLDALAGGEQRLLVRVDEHGDQHALEQLRAAQHDVDVPVGQRIEGSRKDGEAAVRGASWCHGRLKNVSVLSPDFTSRTRCSEAGASGSRRVARSRTSRPPGASIRDAASSAPLISVMSYGGSSQTTSNAAPAACREAAIRSRFSIV